MTPFRAYPAPVAALVAGAGRTSEEKPMDMPVVNACQVESCAYNRDRACHALAITVGDALLAQCDTYFATPAKGGDPSVSGKVGACKVAECRHNERFECQAPGIEVGPKQEAAECLTFAPA